MIRKATAEDLVSAAELAALLWPEAGKEELEREFRDLLEDGECALFLASEGDRDVGFAQCQLRHDYVEGTDSSPVGYLEGVYVAEGYRRNGYAAALLHACEQWAKEKGCTEFASDCELDNAESLRFHRAVGFTEANRIICFQKKL